MLRLSDCHQMLVQPNKARKLDPSCSSTSATSGAALYQEEHSTSLADLARKVLVLDTLPFEMRAKAMTTWLQTARKLGDEQYNQCVQLAVSLLMRRNGSAGQVRTHSFLFVV